jgi:hypothetical protein
MTEEQIKKLEALLETQSSNIEVIRERIRELEDDLVSIETCHISLGNLICELKSKE